MIEEHDPVEILIKHYRVAKQIVEDRGGISAAEAIGRSYGYAESLRFLGHISEKQFDQVANKLLFLRSTLVKKEENL